MNVDEVKALFPEALQTILEVEESESKYTVRLTKFVSKDLFSKIAQVVKDSKGTYVSQGKNSHFTIPKNTVAVENQFKQAPQTVTRVPVEQILSDFEDWMSEGNRILGNLSAYVFHSKPKKEGDK